jgi:hypothetical protein
MNSNEPGLNLGELPVYLASTLAKVLEEEKLIDALCYAVLSSKNTQIARRIATQLTTTRGNATENDSQVPEL